MFLIFVSAVATWLSQAAEQSEIDSILGNSFSMIGIAAQQFVFCVRLLTHLILNI